METQNTELIGFIVFIVLMVFVMYYVSLIGAVLEKQITKRRFLIGVIPFAIWILIFIESFNELE
jgi:hypothetical protein